MAQYDVIVIGRGLIGSAAARHLSLRGLNVLLIGPGEPTDHHTHDGIFGSHYDSGRIVRILDPFPHYAKIAKAAIARFRPLEDETGIRFYHEVGYLVVSNNEPYLEQMKACAAEFYSETEHIRYTDLSDRFPYFAFPDRVQALYQATHGGHLNPRRHIAAQNKALKMRGGEVIDAIALEIETQGKGVRVRINGGWVSGERVLLATGAFANVGGIIPRQIDFGVNPHTTVLGEISPNQLQTLERMPSLSYRLGDDPMRFVYFMPPIQYPDGKHYVKIGHSKAGFIPNDRESLTRWFQSDGDPAQVEWLSEALHQLLPEVRFASLHSRACVTTQSPTGKQFIDQFGDRPIYSLLADHGQCGKSADELGFIAAEFLTKGQLPAPYEDGAFTLQYI
ncbi:MAG: FAD-dependent oxidoreductase [Chloroflexota bacterium]